jgi:hypothetical protein
MYFYCNRFIAAVVRELLLREVRRAYCQLSRQVGSPSLRP